MILYYIDIYCIDTCTDTETLTFRTSLNTGHIDHVLAVSADIGRFDRFWAFQSVLSVLADIEKKPLFFLFFFVIFEFF